jgi:hypothetical protein
VRTKRFGGYRNGSGIAIPLGRFPATFAGGVEILAQSYGGKKPKRTTVREIVSSKK